MATTSPKRKTRSTSLALAPNAQIECLTPVERANRYIRNVLDGTQPACKWVKAACKRQRDDLKRKSFAYHFSDKAANDPCNFAEALPHIKGRQFAGQTLVFSDWQCFIVTTAFGWLDKFGMRRFKTVYIEVPRKNGKSTMSAPIALYMMSADGEPGADVYSAATTRDQAKIVWADAKAMVERCKNLRVALNVATSVHAIYQLRTASRFLPLSRDQQGNLDGLNIHCAVIDELHAHKTRDIWDVIETGTGARSQPLVWTITTAGSNRAGICFEQRTYVTKILDGKHVDETYFGIIYTIDKEDLLKKNYFQDPEVWAKANPNYGISVNPEDLERKALKALKMPSALNNFLTKHLDVWVNSDSPWLNMVAWEECEDQSMRIEDFANKDVIDACDLATKTDIAPKVSVFKRWEETEVEVEGGAPGETEVKMMEHYYVFANFYLPRAAIETSTNSQYAGWEQEGLLRVTPGNVTDFSVIEEDIKKDAVKFNLLAAGFDPWQASYLMQRLQVENLTVMEYRQTVQNMSQAMKEVEALILSKRLHHNGNKVLTWMMGNVVGHYDAKENIYPNKDVATNKIDGAVALIMAIGLWMMPREETPDYENSIMFV
jgi:phage terminase large subunit-like protein